MFDLYELLFDVTGITIFDEAAYLFYLLGGSILRRIYPAPVFEGKLLFKDIILNVKSWENSYFYCPRGTDALLQALPYNEKRTMRFIRSVIKRGDVFVDVGANVGKYTVPIAKAVGPEGVVVAVEPSPAYKILEKNIELNCLTNVIVFNKAAYSEKKLLDLHYIPQRSTLSSLYNQSGEGVCLKVDAEPLDVMIGEAGLLGRKIKLIKIDVEGAEVDVILGAKALLSKTEYLVFEARSETFARCIRELTPYNFKIKLLERLGETSNYVAIRS